MADEPGKTATLHTPGGELEMTIRPATEGASAFEIGKLLSSTGLTTYDPGYGNTAPVSSAITYIDGDAGILRYRGYPIDQLAEKSTFLETSYLLIYGELPTQESSTRSPRRSAGTRCCTRTSRRSSTASRATRTRCRCCPVRGLGAVDVLPGRARPVRRGRGRALDRAAAGQAAHDRGVRLQEVDRPAVPLPGQLAGPGRELPADDLRLPGRAVRGRPGVRQGAGPAADPARRPRAELLDLDGADGRLGAGEPVRVGVGGDQRAVRAAARRGERGGAVDARADPRRRGRQRRRVRRAGQEQGEGRPADGLRAPGLQELRPAREDRQGERGRGAQEARA